MVAVLIKAPKHGHKGLKKIHFVYFLQDLCLWLAGLLTQQT